MELEFLLLILGDKIYTKIIGDDYFRSDIMLLVNELPIMECDLKNSYSVK